MLRVQIKDPELHIREVKRDNGDVLTFREQSGFVALPNGEFRQVRISLHRDAKPFPVGEYQIGDDSFRVGNFGDLQLSRQLVLLPFAK